MTKLIALKRSTAFLLLLVLLSTICTGFVFATDDETEDTKFCIADMYATFNAGKDGYYEQNDILEGDPHYGWELGKFYISGFTRKTEDEYGNPVFLKVAGDEIKLSYLLEQDIDCLNGDDKLSINNDDKGYDEYFGVERSDFGRGTLIVQYTDYQQNTAEPIIYRDFLVANASQEAEVDISLLEEGDYEVALDYQLSQVLVSVLGLEPARRINYTVFFRFSIRNGNCMVFPFDVKTGEELTNSAITENGFYLDLAKSRYLDIGIKKEILKAGAEDLEKDTRFNKPAKDGETFTDEGIYTITVTNKYTNQETTKVIAVGTNDILKAYVSTGKSIKEINECVRLGATIGADGHIIMLETATAQTEAEQETVATTTQAGNESIQEATPNKDSLTIAFGNATIEISMYAIIIAAAGLIIFILLIIIIASSIKRHKKKI